MAVAQKQLQATTDLPAELMPFEDVAIYPRQSGFLKWIGVDRGSRVKKGELLAHLEAPELEAQKAQAQSQYQSAQAALSAAKAHQPYRCQYCPDDSRMCWRRRRATARRKRPIHRACASYQPV